MDITTVLSVPLFNDSTGSSTSVALPLRYSSVMGSMSSVLLVTLFTSTSWLRSSSPAANPAARSDVLKLLDVFVLSRRRSRHSVWDSGTTATSTISRWRPDTSPTSTSSLSPAGTLPVPWYAPPSCDTHSNGTWRW